MDSRIVLHADFEGGTARDASGLNNHGAVCGQPVFGTGFDGGSAIYLANAFGGSARQYVTFSELKGIDLTRDDFTLLFWYKTVEGGIGGWAPSWNAAEAGSGMDMTGKLQGGILLSNRPADPAAPGFLAAQLPQRQYFAAGITDGSGTPMDMDGIWQPQDDRWHQLALTAARAGALRITVDGEPIKETDISPAAGQAIGSNTLVLGADLAGRFGVGSVWVDKLQLFRGVLTEAELRDIYERDRLSALRHEAAERAATAGSQYTEAAKAEMLAKIAAADSYDQLKQDFDAFLLSPEQDAKLCMLLLSDIHITAPDCATARALRQVFAGAEKLGVRIDGMFNAGDITNNSHPDAMQCAFDVLNGLLEKHRDWQMAACFGNHDTHYTNEGENYLRSTPVYWQNLQAHIGDKNRKFGSGKLDGTHHFNYGLTYKGFHMLVLNTDYKPQTGCSKEIYDENGKWSIEGNKLDPIRHGMYFEEETLGWIREMLDGYSKDGLPIFVMTHFPFIDSCPLSYYREIVIYDNSIGPQDAEIRSILADYRNVIYLCGHLHSSAPLGKPVKVATPDGRSFTQINIASQKRAARGYCSDTTSWILQVYEKEILLRACDFKTGQWLTAYDHTIALT